MFLPLKTQKEFIMQLILIVALLTLCLSGISFAAEAGSNSADAKADSAVTAVDKFIAEQKEAGKINTDKEGWKTRLPKPPKVSFDDTHDYFWVMETNKGTIKIKLMPKVAPMHVSSTLYLVKLGFYDGLTYHRDISDFMAQGGCPLGTGTGGPGYKYDGEFDKSLKHDKPYLLSMANAGPGTNGSQFFITHLPTPWLDDGHTIFGQLQDDASQAVVDSNAQGDVIESVRIEGDSDALLDDQSDRVSQWNAALDR
jgi:cyclophilin family peptidyl-prolyl cis-trans isomerase